MRSDEQGDWLKGATPEPIELSAPETGKIKVQTVFASGREKYTTVTLKHRFATAIVDPDWPYTVAPGRDDVGKADGDGRLSGYTRNRDQHRNQYRRGEPLSIDELCALPIGDVVGGYVLLWAVGPFLINGVASKVLDAWGFVPKSILTWAKYNLRERHGYGGVGFWFLGNAEFCIVGKREGWPSIRTGKSSLMIEPKGQHSSKPDNLHRLCEERFPGPYLEVFGRDARKDWVVVGDESPGDGRDVRESLRELAVP